MWENPDAIKTKKVNMKVEYESTPIRHVAVVAGAGRVPVFILKSSISVSFDKSI